MDRPSKPDRSPDDLYRYSALGIEFALIIGLFLLLGWWLDGRLGTRPWLMVSGLAIGFAAAMYRMVKVLRERR